MVIQCLFTRHYIYHVRESLRYCDDALRDDTITKTNVYIEVVRLRESKDLPIHITLPSIGYIMLLFHYYP